MKELHRKVFERTISYTPLLVKLKSMSQQYTPLDCMSDPKKAIQHAESNFKHINCLKSDIIPFVESNFMECLVPSIFGAETHVAPGGQIDVKQCFSSIYETENVRIDDIFTGEMKSAIKHLEYLRDHVPSYLYVNPTRPMSPLDYAVVMCGGEFYTELLAEPELAIRFMEKITDVTIKTIKHFKNILKQPEDECLTVRGLCYPGIRLTGDAIVNLSPSMIKNIMCPFYKRFEEEFGRVMLHYCCTPAPSTHVAPALIEGGGVSAIDNWQGYYTMLSKNDYFQDTLAICTDIDKADILSKEIFKDEFITYKGRPLTVSTVVDSIDEGNKVYEIWQEYNKI